MKTSRYTSAESKIIEKTTNAKMDASSYNLNKKKYEKYKPKKLLNEFA